MPAIVIDHFDLGRYEMEEKNLEGLRGWLILVGIGLVITPFKYMFGMKPYIEMFSTGTWGVIVTKNPLFAGIIIGEILVNIGLMLAWLYVAHLFFSKKRTFPKFYILISFLSLIFLFADAFALKLVFPNEPTFGPDISKALVGAFYNFVIWVPYMLRSKRVKATFVDAYISGQCFNCIHIRRDSYQTCNAFPKGIPNKIFTGKYDHTKPYKGDNGIRFVTRRGRKKEQKI